MTEVIAPNSGVTDDDMNAPPTAAAQPPMALAVTAEDPRKTPFEQQQLVATNGDPMAATVAISVSAGPSTQSASTPGPTTIDPTPASTSLLDTSDEKAWPSLSSSAAPRSSSTVWGPRSGADLVRHTTPPGAVGDRPAHAVGQNGVGLDRLGSSYQHLSMSSKRVGIVVEKVELPVDEPMQKREFGGKNSTADIIRRIQEQTDTNVEMSSSRRTTTFLIKGRPDDAKRARRELLSSLARKEDITLHIPVSVRRYILGAGGKTLKAITNSTNTRIRLPPRQEDYGDGRNELDVEEDEELMDVKIEGDMEGVSMAKDEILKIAKERTQKRVHKITHIEPHFYPLIAGAHNQRIQQIQNETGAKIHLPPYVATGDAGEGHDNNHNGKDNTIIVMGEKDAVKKAKEQIEDVYEHLKSTTATMQLTIQKHLHRYLVGPKGIGLHEILETTSCSLELAPPNDPNESITIRGELAHFAKAMELVTSRASSISVETLDLVQFHHCENPTEHARNVLKYLRNRGKLRKVETETGVQITESRGVGAPDKGVGLEFAGKDRAEVEKARKEISELVSNLPPNYFAIASIEPHLHRHIIGRKGQNLQRVKDMHGVEIVVPDEKDGSPAILVVFEGKDAGDLPTDNRKRDAQVKDVLQKAKEELIKAGQDASDFATKTMEIPVKYHRHIIGHRGGTLNGITGGIDAPVSVKFGSSRTGAAERSANAEGKKGPLIPISDDIVVIKGPTEEVGRVVREITRVVEEAKHNEVMNSYQIEFTFPAQYYGHVIGKEGKHISRIKDALNVKIEIDGGAKNEDKKSNPNEKVKVEIQGMKNNVEEAKNKILDLIEKLQDATEVRLDIPAEYHKSLIGQRGRYVKRLEEKYGVHIRFPRNRSADHEDGADDTDGQKPDEVIVKGSKKGVSDAKSELLELLNYEKDHGNSLHFTISAKHLPHIVGRGGSKISEIKTETYTRIDIGRADASDGNEDQEVPISIHGTADDIVRAKEAILAIVRELENQTTITIYIDPIWHKHLIGPGGSRIRELVARAGGPEDKSAQAGIVKFPRHGTNSDEVVLKGEKQLVEKVQEELLKIVEEKANTIVAVVPIPRAQHPQIIGRGGAALREIQSKFNVEIQFPGSRSYNNMPLTQEQSDQITNIEEAVKIIGRLENIEAAKAEILTRIRYKHTYKVPRKFHAAIAANGATARKLRNEYGVMVDHGSETPPEVKTHSNGELRRIDDEDEISSEIPPDGLFIEIVENDDNEETGEISWNLMGERTQVERAEKYLEELLEESRNHTCTGYITVPQYLHRHVIGRGGGTISRIRSESGCRIDVPKGKDDEVVVVTGSREGVKQAYKLMSEIVDRAGNRQPFL